MKSGSFITVDSSVVFTPVHFGMNTLEPSFQHFTEGALGYFNLFQAALTGTYV